MTIGILHFILYYFNFDFNFENFNYFKPDYESKKQKSIHTEASLKSETNVINSQIVNQILIDSINELKTLNECINNGEINTSFS